MRSGQDLLEGPDGVLEGNEFTLITREDLGDLEMLRHETLDLTCALDTKLVFLRQPVHTENGDDILERLVVLEDLLDSSGDLVVLGSDLRQVRLLSANHGPTVPKTYDTGVKHTRL